MSYNPYFEGTLNQYNSNYGTTGNFELNESDTSIEPVYLYVPDSYVSDSLSPFSKIYEIDLPPNFNKNIHLTKCKVLKGSLIDDWIMIGNKLFKNNVKCSTLRGSGTCIEFDTEVNTYLDSESNPTKALISTILYNEPTCPGVIGVSNLSFMFYWEAKV